MKLQSSLIQRIEQDYIGNKYKDGIFVFATLDTSTISSVIESFLLWSLENKIIEEDVFNKLIDLE